MVRISARKIKEIKMKTALPGSSSRSGSFLMILLAFTIALVLALPARAQLTQISVDNLTNTDSVHKTEVEPDMFAWGHTIVSTYRVARTSGPTSWGGSGVGFATSSNGGVS